jgi:alkanesulfonate monooxygenase SsuD/methylene tetrahydromethanopterin reductase-like flavin-dependent oxidoreductase (luciferase family)
MRFGVTLPQIEDFSDIHRLVGLAQAAEAAGWDGFFIWDSILFDHIVHPILDPWIALAAVACATQRMRLGILVAPLARRRPWKVARETVALDHLSHGRLILGVGLGEPARWEYAAFGEEPDAKLRAEKLDEALEILTGLWRGEEFRFTGKHYQLQPVRFRPTPQQEPRIPIWVGGVWPHKAPIRRAARYDGVVPIAAEGMLSPDDWRELLDYLRQHRTETGPFDAVAMGVTRADDPDHAAATVAAYAEAGCTWWIEDISPYSHGVPWDAPQWTPAMVAQLETRLRHGPPRA